MFTPLFFCRLLYYIIYLKMFMWSLFTWRHNFHFVNTPHQQNAKLFTFTVIWGEYIVPTVTSLNYMITIALQCCYTSNKKLTYGHILHGSSPGNSPCRRHTCMYEGHSGNNGRIGHHMALLIKITTLSLCSILLHWSSFLLFYPIWNCTSIQHFQFLFRKYEAICTKQY